MEGTKAIQHKWTQAYDDKMDSTARFNSVGAPFAYKFNKMG